MARERRVVSAAGKQARINLDYCPKCGRRIRDMDMTGLEAPDGQRWCTEHAPEELLAEMKITRDPSEVAAVDEGNVIAELPPEQRARYTLEDAVSALKVGNKATARQLVITALRLLELDHINEDANVALRRIGKEN